MKVVDLSILLYAINTDSPHHEAARAWLEQALSEEEPVAFAWVVILGFLRIATHPRVFPDPLPADDALEVMDGWLSRPNAQVLVPGDDHWRLLRALLREAGAAGNLTTDTHLAAMVIENGAELVSADSDFNRFPRLRFRNPLS